MPEYPYLDIKSPLGEKSRAEIKEKRLTIGRLEEWSDVVLCDPQQLISRIHCIVEYENGWWVRDNGSINRTFLRRKQDESLEIVQGKARIQSGDVICILGRFLEEGEQLFWELAFCDVAATNPAGPETTSNVILEYDWTQARLYRTEHGYRQELPRLRPQEHKLVRYMAQRNRNNGEPVLCAFEDLIAAVWGDESTAPDTLAHLVWQLRQKIDKNQKQPLLETIKGFGYRLQIRSLE